MPLSQKPFDGSRFICHFSSVGLGSHLPLAAILVSATLLTACALSKKADVVDLKTAAKDRSVLVMGVAVTGTSASIFDHGCEARFISLNGGEGFATEFKTSEPLLALDVPAGRYALEGVTCSSSAMWEFPSAPPDLTVAPGLITFVGRVAVSSNAHRSLTLGFESQRAKIRESAELLFANLATEAHDRVVVVAGDQRPKALTPAMVKASSAPSSQSVRVKWVGPSGFNTDPLIEPIHACTETEQQKNHAPLGNFSWKARYGRDGRLEKIDSKGKATFTDQFHACVTEFLTNFKTGVSSPVSVDVEI